MEYCNNNCLRCYIKNNIIKIVNNDSNYINICKKCFCDEYNKYESYFKVYNVPNVCDFCNYIGLNYHISICKSCLDIYEIINRYDNSSDEL